MERTAEGTGQILQSESLTGGYQLPDSGAALEGAAHVRRVGSDSEL